MLKLNSELRAQAREALQGNWVMAAVAALIYSAIVSATSYLPLVGTLLVGLPVAYGFTILMFSVIKGAKDIDLGILFEGFKDYSRIMDMGCRVIRAKDTQICGFHSHKVCIYRKIHGISAWIHHVPVHVHVYHIIPQANNPHLLPLLWSYGA